MPGRLNIVVFVLAVTSVVTPCAAQFQWPFGKKNNNSATAGAAASSLPARPPVSSTAPARASATGGQHPYFNQRHPALSSTVPKKENPISAAWKKATQSVGDALTIKPKVIPAEDPTRLSTKPGPVGPDLYLTAARLMEDRNQPEAAKVQYERALAIDANHLLSLLGLGRLYHREGQMDDAIRMCLRATQAHPQSAVAYNDLGLCYSRQSRVQSATRALSTAVELDPESKLYRSNLAAALVQAGRNDEALMHWRHVHGTAVAHYNLGYLLYKQGKKDAAREQFKLALAQDPELRQAAQMLTRLKPQQAGVRSKQLPIVINAPPATPAQTQPPVANRAFSPPGPAATPPAGQPHTSPGRVTTGTAPPRGTPYEPPAAPRPRREPVVDTFPRYENRTGSPTTPAPVVRPEDYRKSPFSGGPVRDASPQDASPAPPARQNAASDSFMDHPPVLENSARSSTPPAPVVQPRDYRNRSFSEGQVSPTPLLFGPRQDRSEPQGHLAPILTPREAAAQRFQPPPPATEAATEPNQRDPQALPALEGPANPPGVVRARPNPTNAPQPSDRDSRFSLGAPPAGGDELFSPQREPLPVFSPRPSDGLDAGNEREPAHVIEAIDPAAAEHEPFSLPQEPPLKYVPQPPEDRQPSDERGPDAVIDTSQPPAFLRHRPADTDPESGWQNERGYVRLKPQQASPTPEPRSMPDTRPDLRLPAIERVEENPGRPAAPPLPPEQDARFAPSTIQQPRELWPVR